MTVSSSRPKSPVNKPMTRSRRRSNSEGRFCRAQKSSTTVVVNGNGGGGGGGGIASSVSDKLEALRNLLPAAQIDGEIKADQLFQETAEYIVLLRTRVLILQRLIDLYGSSENEKQC